VSWQDQKGSGRCTSDSHYGENEFCWLNTMKCMNAKDLGYYYCDDDSNCSFGIYCRTDEYCGGGYPAPRHCEAEIGRCAPGKRP